MIMKGWETCGLMKTFEKFIKHLLWRKTPNVHFLLVHLMEWANKLMRMIMKIGKICLKMLNLWIYQQMF